MCWPSWVPGYQAKAHLEALAEVRPFDDIRIGSRTHSKAEELAERHPAARAAHPWRKPSVTPTSSSRRRAPTEPVLDREWLADGAHINAVGAVLPAHARAGLGHRCRDSTFVVDSRESAVNESGDYLIALAEGAIGEGHIAAELGDVLVGDASRAGRRPTRSRCSSRSAWPWRISSPRSIVVDRARQTGRGHTVSF